MPTIADLSDLLDNGKLADAKRAATVLLSDADSHDLEVINYCVHVLNTWPKVGVLKLRAYWCAASEHDRTLIAACVQERMTQPRREQTSTRAPRWTSKNKHEAPRDVRHEIRPERIRAPRPRNDAAVDTYFGERRDQDDEPNRHETPDGYALDYDRAAVPALRDAPCVSCWLERATLDRTHRPDGLCTECRDRGRQGIPPLPHGYTRVDVIQARCAFLAERYPAAAVRLLRRYWQQCRNDEDRTTVAHWVDGHEFTPSDDRRAALEVDLDACTSCCEPRNPRDTRHNPTDDGLCATCRSVDQPA